MVENLPEMKETRVRSLDQEDPLDLLHLSPGSFLE